MGTTGQSITLANSIIGVGVLAMPYCFQQCGVALATLILLLMGLVSRLCCYYLLKSALIAKRRNFEYLAFHVFGSTGKLAVEVGVIGFLMGTCIAYFVVVGDLGPQIIAKMLNINQSDMLRTSIMVIVSLVCVIPLGLLRNVDSLSNVSAATIGFYICLVLKVILEAMTQLSSEWPARVEMWKPSGVLQCVPIFSMALFCQTQLFEIFESMPSLSLEKMNVVTKNAINICTGVYFTLGLFGYVAFASQTISGNILVSLSPTMASDIIKLGFVMSVAFSFPLIIFPCRASLYSFLFKKVHLYHHDHIVNHSIPTGTFRCITVGIVVSALLVSLALPNIELVLGLVGSTIGVMICILFPAACFVNVTFKNTNERVLAKVIMGLGLVIMVLGTYANLQAAEIKLDRYDDKFTQERIDKIVEDFFESKKIGKFDEHIAIKPPEKENLKYENDVDKETIVKDSEVQPPNPVPPDSLSEEKPKRPAVEEVNVQKEKQDNEAKLQESLPVPELKENIEKVSDSRLSVKDVKPDDEKDVKAGQNLEKKIEIKAQPNELDKTDKLKQEKLIETIKQHGREQKELIKEQKEILHEIIKTKNEMQQKNEADNIQAKKIAVESIQKIANMAIQSISGVSEKPGLKKVNGAEQSKSIANEAVQEIAKKAVETLEAIKDDKVVQDAARFPAKKESGQMPIISQLNGSPPQKVQELVSNQNLGAKIEEKTNKQSGSDIEAAPVKSQNQNIKTDFSVDETRIKQQKISPDQIELKKISKALDSTDDKEQVVVHKEHSHLPDEPQSYKLGEDSQKVNPNPDLIKKDTIPDLLLPLVKSSNLQINSSANDKKAVKVESVQSLLDDKEGNKNVRSVETNQLTKESVGDNVQPNDANQKLVQRRKREAIDCTEKVHLQPEAKEICQKHLTKPIDSEEILSAKVDFTNGGLPNNVPLFHIRSLKTVDETKKR